MRRGVVQALAILYVVWGSTYLAMRVAVETLPPLAMAGVRFVLAGSVLLGVLRWRASTNADPTSTRDTAFWPTKRQWLLAFPIGLCLFVGGNGFVVLAERTLPSSLAAVVCATTPLVASAVAATTGERPSLREVFGMVLGVVGVVILVGDAGFTHAPREAYVVLGAPVTWALGSILARKTGATNFASAAAQMIVGGLCLLVASVVHGESIPDTVSARSVVAWIYLVVFGSLVGFSAYAFLLRHTRPATAFSYAYVNPIVALLLGVALGGEAMGWTTVLAAFMIAGGVVAVVAR